MVVINNALARLPGAISQVTQSSQLVPFVNTDGGNVVVGQVAVADPANGGGALNPSSASDTGQMFVIREVRQGDVSGNFVIAPNQPGTGMKVGFAIAKCVNGTPQPDKPVYYRYAKGETGDDTVRTIGSIEAAAIANEVIEFPGATFNGLADADGLVEIRINA